VYGGISPFWRTQVCVEPERLDDVHHEVGPDAVGRQGLDFGRRRSLSGHVMTGGATGREGGGTVGMLGPISSVGATRAAAPSSPPVRRKSRRSIDTGAACFGFFDRAISRSPDDQITR